MRIEIGSIVSAKCEGVYLVLLHAVKPASSGLADLSSSSSEIVEAHIVVESVWYLAKGVGYTVQDPRSIV